MNLLEVTSIRLNDSAYLRWRLVSHQTTKGHDAAAARILLHCPGVCFRGSAETCFRLGMASFNWSAPATVTAEPLT